MIQAGEKPLRQPVRYLRGVGPKRSEALERLGIRTLEDFFYYFPRRLEDRSRLIPIEKIVPGEFATVKGEIMKAQLRRIKNMSIVEVSVGDETGLVHAVWFNQPYLKKQFFEGGRIFLSGKAELYKNRLQMNAPDHELLSGSDEDTIHTGRIVPIYPLTEGLGQRGIRRAMKELLDEHLGEVQEFLPAHLRERLGLCGLREAIRNIHFPESAEAEEAARARLIFDEFFLFEIALLLRIQKDRKNFMAYAFSGFSKHIDEYRKTLPFKLTASQDAVLEELAHDVGKPSPMRRLLQGDVGSGKTVVAVFLLYWAAKSGYQSVLMAPTEVLAEQHYQTVKKFLAPFGIKVSILTGSTPENERGEILVGLRSGTLSVAVGTHALIQEGIKFQKLAVAVIDEQHKFGVRQRAALLTGEIRPHLLVMTATPIPRTLGLTLYGDLDISTINELPSGRKPIETYWISKAKENEILEHVRKKVLSGDQAYIIFPIIEETEKSDLLAATKEYENLKKGLFRDVGIGLIHGRLTKWEKETVMKDFKEGKIKVLVSTSLVEVGIDNPNATIMIVEHAERFGLSQLHQLRGRIGRGSKESFCFLFGNPTTDEGKKRLRILTKTTDGFMIAEEDLKLRGPGDFLGTRQSGLPLFRIGDLLKDAAVLRLARKEALELIERGELAKNESLKQEVEEQAKHFFNAVKD